MATRPGPARSRRKGPAEDLPDSAGRKPLVLIVESDRRDLRRLERIFRSAGWAVESAYDGWQALEIALERRPDLITLETGVPHDSATWFYRRRSLWPRLVATPLVVITRAARAGDGVATPDVVRGWEREGLPPPSGCVAKPLRPEELRRVIEAHAHGREDPSP